MLRAPRREPQAPEVNTSHIPGSAGETPRGWRWGFPPPAGIRRRVPATAIPQNPARRRCPLSSGGRGRHLYRRMLDRKAPLRGRGHPTGRQAGSGVPELVATLIIRKATLHCLLGLETLGASFVEVVAALGTGVSVIFPSLMIGIDQGIIGERQQTFGEAVEGMLLYGSKHFRRCLLAGI